MINTNVSVSEEALEAAAEARAARAAAQAQAPPPPAASPAPTPEVQGPSLAPLANDVRTVSAELGQAWTEVASSPAQPAPVPTETAAAPASPSPYSERDQQLQANPELEDVRSRYQAYQEGMPRVTGVVQETESGSVYGEIEPTAEERAAYAAQFVDSQSGITGAELQHLDKAIEAENQRIEAQRIREQAAAQFSEASYGLSDRDEAILADPRGAAALARFSSTADGFTQGLSQWQMQNTSESGGISDPAALQNFTDNYMDRQAVGVQEGETVYQMTLRYPDEASFLAGYVDPETGFTGAELAHLRRTQTEQQQGDAAMQKLEGLKVGSFSGNQTVQSVDATQVFTVIGQDQREALMAKGYSPLGKGFVLNETGQLILPDEHETGVYFLSNSTVHQLEAGGVIDVGNGGLNIDGLYLDGGSAYIGTERPKGGLFGSLLNVASRLLPGGAVGRVVGDAISDVNQFLNQPVHQVLNAVGDDHGFASQVLGHQEATVDVVAHSSETGNRTYDELVRRTAEYDQVDQVANVVGQAMISTGVLAWAGAAITVASGAMMAGHAQLQGQNDADPNQGITQAATAYMLAQTGSALGGGITEALGDTSVVVDTATGVSRTVTTANTASTAASGFVNNVVAQAVTTGDVNLRDALEAGVLGGVGFNTEISHGVNAVQVARLGEALVDGDASAIGSAVVGVVGTVANHETQATPPAATGEGPVPETQPIAPVAEGSGSPSTQPASVRDLLEDFVQSFPLDDFEPIASGDRLAEAGPTVTRTPDAMDRARISEQSEVTTRPDGATVITQPDGVQRTILANGVVLESQEGSNHVSIRTTTQDATGRNQAFAAAREAGLGAYEWNGQLRHTGTGDQVNAMVENALSRNAPALQGLGEEGMQRLRAELTAAGNQAFSQHALDIERGIVPNTAGFDPATFERGTLSALSHLQPSGTGPASTPTPMPDTALFQEGAEGPRAGDLLSRRTFSWDSPEIVANSRDLDRQFGALPAASTVRTWEDATAQIERIQQRHPELSSENLDMALRTAFYADERNASRNGFPVFDPLLGSRYNDPDFMAAVRDVRLNLPQQFPGPNGQMLDMSHAWVGVNALNNNNPVVAAVLTHGGDLGQVLGQAVENGIATSWTGIRTLFQTGSPGAALAAAGATAQANPDPWGWAPPSQMDANTMGWRLGVARRFTTNMADAMRLIAGTTPPRP